MSKRYWTTGVLLLLLVSAVPVHRIRAEISNRTPLWTFQTAGAIWSSPTVFNGVVLVGSDDQHLYAVDAQSGELKWSFATEGMVRSRPAAVGNRVYFASDDGYLYALDIVTGSEVWKLDIGNAAVERLLPDHDYNWDYLQSSPVVVDTMLYIGSADSRLYAVDITTGTIVWRFETEHIIRSSPAVADGIVYVGGWDGYVYAVEAQTGEEVWRFDARTEYIHIQSSPSVVDGTVYIGSRNSHVYALEATTGERLWAFKYRLEWVESSPTVVDGVVYVGSSMDCRLYAIDRATGALKWDFDTIGVAFSSPAVADGRVFIGSASWQGLGGYLYAINTDQTVKHLSPDDAVWRVETGPSIDTSPLQISGVGSSPVVNDEIVYFGGLDGKLYGVSIAD